MICKYIIRVWDQTVKLTLMIQLIYNGETFYFDMHFNLRMRWVVVDDNKANILFVLVQSNSRSKLNSERNADRRKHKT